jgi:branched-chain amino acid transport system substrate-binding protein
MEREMRFRTIPALLATVALLASGLVGCAVGEGSDDQGSDDTYEILALLPLSGPLAVFGKGGEAAIKAAVEVINDNGGFAGRQAELTVKDDKGDPAEVAALTQAAVSGGDVPDLIMPGLSSNEVLAGIGLTAEAGVLATSVAINATLADHEMYMSASPPPAPAARAVLEQAVADGAESVALIVSDDEVGLTAIDLYGRIADDMGIEIVASERIPSTSVDATGSLDRVKAEEPDAIIMSMFGAVVSAVLKGRPTVGLVDTPTYGDQTLALLPEMTTPAALENFQLVNAAYLVKGTPSATSEAMTTAVETMEKFNGGPIKIPMFIYLNSYMSLMLVKYAADEAGSSDPEKVYKARNSLDAADMPLYAGTSDMLFESGGNYPDYTPKDYISFALGGFEHGFFVPAK